MKTITKKNEPNSLTKHRANQPASYGNLPNADTRKSLLEEQGHICCYCMKRIPESQATPSSKIEHFLCQDHNEKEELNYKNMLLACSGQEGSPLRLQTCDTRKGNQNLTNSPYNSVRNIEDLIKYKPNGEIYSSDDTFNTELETVLNLNVKNLKDNRRVVYEEVQNRIRQEGKRQGNLALKKKFLETEKEKLLNLNRGKFLEYCMVGVYVIDKRLRRMT